MSMVLVDILNLFKLYITKNEKEYEKYSIYFDTSNHTIEILEKRILSFVYQSSTTIDYFHYVYK